MNLHEWAIAWGVSMAALKDLQARMGQGGTAAMEAVNPRHKAATSEGAASNLVRLEASRKGVHLWRNNVGVLFDRGGRPVRFGLANDSPAINDVIKSSDLIGVRPRVIQPHDVGHMIGQFVAREVKEPGWAYSGDDHEKAQQAFINLVLAVGGDAAFATGEGTL